MKIVTSRQLNDIAELRPSPLHGLGLFAKRDIPARTVWWKARRSNALLLNQKMVQTFQESMVNETMASFMEVVRIYGYYSSKLDSIIVCLDNARFVNHSDEPNSGAPPNADPLSSMALRDIPAGEEITENYSHYDICPWCTFTCSNSFWELDLGRIALQG